MYVYNIYIYVQCICDYTKPLHAQGIFIYIIVKIPIWALAFPTGIATSSSKTCHRLSFAQARLRQYLDLLHIVLCCGSNIPFIGFGGSYPPN